MEEPRQFVWWGSSVVLGRSIGFTNGPLISILGGVLRSRRTGGHGDSRPAFELEDHSEAGGRNSPSSEEEPLNRNQWVRQIHRWVSIAFTLIVVIVMILSAGGEEPAEWVFLLPLLPLAVLAITGLYLFALPYAARWRRGR